MGKTIATAPAIPRNTLIGRALTRLLQTAWSEPVCHVEGLGYTAYCDVVLDLEGDLFELRYDTILPWDGREPLSDLRLTEHRLETERSPLGRCISAVGLNDLDDVHVVFDNDIVANIDNVYGWCLWLIDVPAFREAMAEGEESPTLRDWWSGARFGV